MLKNKFHFLLAPFAMLYGTAIGLRHLLFDWGVLPQKKYTPCVIVVGNLAIGGTGKTPHVVLLAKELKKEFSVVILSRGYKRSSKGFRWVLETDKATLAGDEPLEMKLALPDIPIATDGNRRRGIERILAEMEEAPQIIILDDGFQHRFVKPDFSLVLSRANRPYFSDFLLPQGRLRDSKKALKRADALCFTHYPEDQSESDLLAPDQGFKGLVIHSTTKLLLPKLHFEDYQILLISGIANGSAIIKQLNISKLNITHLNYPDHHPYSKKDIEHIIRTFDSINGPQKLILTTGKDWVKLKDFDLLQALPVHQIQLQVSLVANGQEALIKKIKAHV